MASSEASSIYLDANVFIYAIERGNPWTDALRGFFEKLHTGERKAVTSELTLAEVLPKPLALGANDLVLAYETLLSAESPIEVLPINRMVLHEAASLRGQSKLKLADAIHAATALYGNCTDFLSNDMQLLELLPSGLRRRAMQDLARL
jgi:predicted nucleic acid-binding protein